MTAKIDDPKSYFQHFKVQMSNVKQGSITRFEGLTNQGLKVHIFGPLSHRAGQLTPNNNIEVTKNAKTPHNIIYARCSADDKFFTVK